MKSFRPHRIPPKTHPLVRETLGIMNEQRLTIKYVMARAGVHKSAFSDWRNRCFPHLGNLEAVLEVLGYEIVIQRSTGNSGRAAGLTSSSRTAPTSVAPVK